MSSEETPELVHRWMAANQAYLEAEKQRLRLLLQRRVAWLRRRWQQDPLLNYQAMVISEAQADWLLEDGDREAEARFYEGEPGMSAIARSLATVERELADQLQATMEDGLPLPIPTLTSLFNLSAFERDVLLLCLAPELDPAFATLYAYVQDNVSCRYATPHLALALFCRADEASARNSFLPQAPLRRFQLVTPEPGAHLGMAPGACPLHLDERVADYLQGINRPDEHIVDLLKPLPYALPVPSHNDLVDRLACAFESGAEQGVRPLLNLTGPPDTGKQAVARGLCERLGLTLSRLDAERLPASGPERQEMLRRLNREATLTQLALYLDTSGLDPTDKPMTASLNDAIERLDTLLVIDSQERWKTDQQVIAVRVVRPDAAAQQRMWRQAMEGVGYSLDGHIEDLVQQFDFGPQAIAQAVDAAMSRAQLRAPAGAPTVTADDLWQACREQAGWQIDELARRVASCYTWEDIVLPEDTLCLLHEIADQVMYRARVYDAWGFGDKLSRGRGISALFSGPSGTGKTMAAEVLANHLKLDLHRIDLAGVVSKYIGETEKNLKRVFEAAEQSGTILFFDEADALFGKRTEVKDSHDRYANIEVNYLLQRMEDYRGLAILATNSKSALDWAFLRRLRFLVDFPFPNAENRRLIWEKAFPVRAHVGELDCKSLARLEIPGGNIHNIAINAAFLAAGEGMTIGMEHVMHAARREYAKIDKLPTEAEFGPHYNKVRS